MGWKQTALFIDLLNPVLLVDTIAMTFVLLHDNAMEWEIHFHVDRLIILNQPRRPTSVTGVISNAFETITALKYRQIEPILASRNNGNALVYGAASHLV